jgi:hypothetical protein
MSIEDIIVRLKEDQRIAEREARQARIARLFDAQVRHPLTKVAPVIQADLFEEMLEQAADPEVEVCGLQIQAEELVASIGRPPVYHKRKTSHEVGEVFSGDINDLYRAAEASLGFCKKGRKCSEVKS